MHTQTPWGIERTDSNNWIGPLRRDGKVRMIAFQNDRSKGLTAAARLRADADAELIVEAVNQYVLAPDKIREALEWLDEGAPGRAREVLMEALKL